MVNLYKPSIVAITGTHYLQIYQFNIQTKVRYQPNCMKRLDLLQYVIVIVNTTEQSFTSDYSF